MYDKKKIKNLVFDVGGILIGFRWIDMFKDHGVDTETALKIGKGIFDNPDWQKYDAGIIGHEILLENFSMRNPELADHARWFFENPILMRVVRPKVYEELKRLKAKGYKFYILSNYAHDLFETHTGDLPFRHMMDGELVSYMVNVTKPDQAIYQALTDKFGIDPKESVFFDDRKENVEAARAFGLNAEHIVDEDEELLLKYLSEF